MAYTLLSEGLDDEGVAALDGRLFDGALDDTWDTPDADLLSVAED